MNISTLFNFINSLKDSNIPFKVYSTKRVKKTINKIDKTYDIIDIDSMLNELSIKVSIDLKQYYDSSFNTRLAKLKAFVEKHSINDHENTISILLDNNGLYEHVIHNKKLLIPRYSNNIIIDAWLNSAEKNGKLVKF